MRDTHGPVELVGNAGVEINLNHDRDGEERDNERLPHDLLALKPEQQHERRQQRDQRNRLQCPERLRQCRLATVRKQ